MSSSPSNAKQSKSASATSLSHQNIGPGGRAVAVDAATKIGNLKRLRRIEGQVRGLTQMVQQDRYCADILIQVAAVQQALRAVSRELWKNHLKHCVAHALQSGGQSSQQMYDELVRLNKLSQ